MAQLESSERSVVVSAPEAKREPYHELSQFEHLQITTELFNILIQMYIRAPLVAFHAQYPGLQYGKIDKQALQSAGFTAAAAQDVLQIYQEIYDFAEKPALRELHPVELLRQFSEKTQALLTRHGNDAFLAPSPQTVNARGYFTTILVSLITAQKHMLSVIANIIVCQTSDDESVQAKLGEFFKNYQRYSYDVQTSAGIEDNSRHRLTIITDLTKKVSEQAAQNRRFGRLAQHSFAKLTDTQVAAIHGAVEYYNKQNEQRRYALPEKASEILSSLGTKKEIELTPPQSWIVRSVLSVVGGSWISQVFLGMPEVTTDVMAMGDPGSPNSLRARFDLIRNSLLPELAIYLAKSFLKTQPSRHDAKRSEVFLTIIRLLIAAKNGIVPTEFTVDNFDSIDNFFKEGLYYKDVAALRASAKEVEKNPVKNLFKAMDAGLVAFNSQHQLATKRQQELQELTTSWREAQVASEARSQQLALPGARSTALTLPSAVSQLQVPHAALSALSRAMQSSLDSQRGATFFLFEQTTRSNDSVTTTRFAFGTGPGVADYVPFKRIPLIPSRDLALLVIRVAQELVRNDNLRHIRFVQDLVAYNQDLIEGLVTTLGLDNKVLASDRFLAVYTRVALAIINFREERDQQYQKIMTQLDELIRGTTDFKQLIQSSQYPDMGNSEVFKGFYVLGDTSAEPYASAATGTIVAARKALTEQLNINQKSTKKPYKQIFELVTAATAAYTDVMELQNALKFVDSMAVVAAVAPEQEQTAMITGLESFGLVLQHLHGSQTTGWIFKKTEATTFGAHYQQAESLLKGTMSLSEIMRRDAEALGKADYRAAAESATMVLLLAYAATTKYREYSRRVYTVDISVGEVATLEHTLDEADKVRQEAEELFDAISLYYVTIPSSFDYQLPEQLEIDTQDNKQNREWLEKVKKMLGHQHDTALSVLREQLSSDGVLTLGVATQNVMVARSGVIEAQEQEEAKREKLRTQAHPNAIINATKQLVAVADALKATLASQQPAAVDLGELTAAVHALERFNVVQLDDAYNKYVFEIKALLETSNGAFLSKVVGHHQAVQQYQTAIEAADKGGLDDGAFFTAFAAVIVAQAEYASNQAQPIPLRKLFVNIDGLIAYAGKLDRFASARDSTNLSGSLQALRKQLNTSAGLVGSSAEGVEGRREALDRKLQDKKKAEQAKQEAVAGQLAELNQKIAMLDGEQGLAATAKTAATKAGVAAAQVQWGKLAALFSKAGGESEPKTLKELLADLEQAAAKLVDLRGFTQPGLQTELESLNDGYVGLQEQLSVVKARYATVDKQYPIEQKTYHFNLANTLTDEILEAIGDVHQETNRYRLHQYDAQQPHEKYLAIRTKYETLVAQLTTAQKALAVVTDELQAVELAAIDSKLAGLQTKMQAAQALIGNTNYRSHENSADRWQSAQPQSLADELDQQESALNRHRESLVEKLQLASQRFLLAQKLYSDLQPSAVTEEDATPTLGKMPDNTTFYCLRMVDAILLLYMQSNIKNTLEVQTEAAYKGWMPAVHHKDFALLDDLVFAATDSVVAKKFGSLKNQDMNRHLITYLGKQTISATSPQVHVVELAVRALTAKQQELSAALEQRNEFLSARLTGEVSQKVSAKPFTLTDLMILRGYLLYQDSNTPSLIQQVVDSGSPDLMKSLLGLIQQMLADFRSLNMADIEQHGEQLQLLELAMEMAKQVHAMVVEFHQHFVGLEKAELAKGLPLLNADELNAVSVQLASLQDDIKKQYDGNDFPDNSVVAQLKKAKQQKDEQTLRALRQSLTGHLREYDTPSILTLQQHVADLRSHEEGKQKDALAALKQSHLLQPAFLQLQLPSCGNQSLGQIDLETVDTDIARVAAAVLEQCDRLEFYGVLAHVGTFVEKWHDGNTQNSKAFGFEVDSSVFELHLKQSIGLVASLQQLCRLLEPLRDTKLVDMYAAAKFDQVTLDQLKIQSEVILDQVAFELPLTVIAEPIASDNAKEVMLAFEQLQLVDSIQAPFFKKLMDFFANIVLAEQVTPGDLNAFIAQSGGLIKTDKPVTTLAEFVSCLQAVQLEGNDKSNLRRIIALFEMLKVAEPERAVTVDSLLMVVSQLQTVYQQIDRNKGKLTSDPDKLAADQHLAAMNTRLLVPINQLAQGAIGGLVKMLQGFKTAEQLDDEQIALAETMVGCFNASSMRVSRETVKNACTTNDDPCGTAVAFKPVKPVGIPKPTFFHHSPRKQTQSLVEPGSPSSPFYKGLGTPPPKDTQTRRPPVALDSPLRATTTVAAASTESKPTDTNTEQRTGAPGGPGNVKYDQ